MSIAVQQLAVSEFRDGEHREAIRYAAGRLAEFEGQTPLPIHHEVHIDRVSRAIRNVRETALQLSSLASQGHKRGTVDIAAPAAQLADLILPQRNFATLVAPGWNPQFDLASDIGGAIPWEVLEEQLAVCHCRGVKTHQSLDPGGVAPSCPHCHQVMQRELGRLALHRHLTHLVRYSQRITLGQGRTFLLVIDPTKNILTKEADPTGTCRAHVDQLVPLLEAAGFKTVKLTHGFATVESVESELKSPQLAGMYYFGHGVPPEKRRPGSLLLADGHLYSDDIANLGATPHFAFLNACWGGRAAATNEFDNRATSVAEALARGGRKVVVGSLFPVVNDQAARAALTFFRNALAGGSLADALQKCRSESYQRYAAGEADVGWMAYRYFGDPNQEMVKPAAQAVSVPTAAEPQAPSVFDENERLVADQFAFDIRAILLRAGARRERQKRQFVTLQDLFAGLLRVGQLTRLCWRDRRRDADQDYEDLRDLPDPDGTPAEEQSDTSHADASPDQELWRLLLRWIVRQRAEFAPAAAAVLDQASCLAASHGRAAGDGRINERDLLLAFCACDSAVKSLPNFDPAVIRRWLDRHRAQTLIDDNGCLCLNSLHPDARRVVERAHELSQQRGQEYIPTRLLLAAFLDDSQGVAARLFRQAGASPSQAKLLLIAMTKGETPVEFPLSLDSCRRVVLPTLQAAGLGDTQATPKSIGEETLFRAFCRVAPRELKQVLKSPELPNHFDLDQIGALPLKSSANSPDSAGGSVADLGGALRQPTSGQQRDPSPKPGNSEQDSKLPLQQFDERGQRALAVAANFARSQGHSQIHSPHLFAGLLAVPGLLTDSLEVQQVSIGDGIAAALRTVQPQAAQSGADPNASMHVSTNVRRWLQRAAQIADQQGDRQIGESHVTSALFAAPSGILSHLISLLQIGPLSTSSANGAAAVSQQTALHTLGWDLTALARRGSLPPFVTREPAIGNLASMLASSPAARIVLIGDSGVGKSSLVEGLARQIADEECLDSLRDCRLMHFSAAVMSGRGRFPAEGWSRLQTVLGAAPENAIVVIDDLMQGYLPAAALSHFDWRVCAGRVVAVLQNWEPFGPAGLAGFQRLQLEPATAREARSLVESQSAALQRRFEVQILDEAIEHSCYHADPKRLPGSSIDLLEKGCRSLAGEPVERRTLTKQILSMMQHE